MDKKTNNNSPTTTIRISVETKLKMKDFADKNGLKLASMSTRAMERALKNSPELFLP